MAAALIAPRYGDAVKQGGLAPHQVTTPDLFAEHTFDFAITLLGPVAQVRIASPSHAIAQQREGEAVQRLLKRIQLAIPVQPRLETQPSPLWSSRLPQRLTPDETIHMFLQLLRPMSAESVLVSGLRSTEHGVWCSACTGADLDWSNAALLAAKLKSSD